MIFVLERSFAVGSVPSIQMYSALKLTGPILQVGLYGAVMCGSRRLGVLLRSLSTGDFPSVAHM